MKLIKTIAISLALAAGVMSCSYNNIADAEYPWQKVYIAAASSGTVYNVNTVHSHTSNTPTSGSVYSFVVKESSLLIPLAVYRSGIDNEGDVRVNLDFDVELVDSLITNGEVAGVTKLDKALLSMPASLVIENGKDNAAFNVEMPLDKIKNAAAGSKFIFGIRLASDDHPVNEKLSRLAVVIDHIIFEEE